MISEPVQFYITTILVLYGTALISAFGLNLQFGVTGILNFGYAVVLGAGGYTAALLSLGPAESTFQQYFFGAKLPFPFPLIAACLVGAAISLLLGMLSLRRVRGDYQALVLLVVSTIATRFVENQKGLLNGGAGLANIPRPLVDWFGSASLTYHWFFVGITAILVILAYFTVQRVSASPFGRILRAVRDNPEAASALGKDPVRYRMYAMVIGGAIGGIGGALSAQYLTGWSTTNWIYLVTFTYFTGIILGGAGNNLGVAFGIALIPVGFREITRLLPPIGYPGMIEALQWVAIGALTLFVLYIRPNGVIPEKFIQFNRKGRSDSPFIQSLLHKNKHPEI